MASKAATKRLTKEYVAMQKDSPPFVWAAPDEKNILTWNFLIRGPPESPFEGGEYHGVLLFPSEYPFKPPGIKMYTPSGRFQPDKRICFSMSDFHPGSWNPAWSVATILTGLLSFMLSDEMTTGSVNSSDADKKAYAARSHSWNIEQRKFKDAFPDFCAPTLQDLPNMGEKERGRPDGASASKVKKAHGPSSSAASSTPTPSSSSRGLASTNNSKEFRARADATAEGAAHAARGTAIARGSGPAGSAVSWSQLMWEKWRWGVLIVFAVVVSRLSSHS